MKEYQLTHTTSSPHYLASNGQAECAVKTIKSLLKNAEDPYAALLAYRATPLPWSPAQLLMGRNIRSILPQTTEGLVPDWPYLQEFRRSDEEFKKTQKRNYDRRYRVRDLPDLPSDTAVFVNTNGNVTTGRTVTTADVPRSYIIETPRGEIRRNRAHINIDPGNTGEQKSAENTPKQRNHDPITIWSKCTTP